MPENSRDRMELYEAIQGAAALIEATVPKEKLGGSHYVCIEDNCSLPCYGPPKAIVEFTYDENTDSNLKLTGLSLSGKVLYIENVGSLLDTYGSKDQVDLHVSVYNDNHKNATFEFEQEKDDISVNVNGEPTDFLKPIGNAMYAAGEKLGLFEDHRVYSIMKKEISSAFKKEGIDFVDEIHNGSYKLENCLTPSQGGNIVDTVTSAIDIRYARANYIATTSSENSGIQVKHFSGSLYKLPSNKITIEKKGELSKEDISEMLSEFTDRGVPMPENWKWTIVNH